MSSAASDAAGPDGLTVGTVASQVGITVRALHHWDSIGPVTPSARTGGGYRLYTAADVARIHRVLIYRELGLPPESIGELLDAPSFEPTPRPQAGTDLAALERRHDGGRGPADVACLAGWHRTGRRFAGPADRGGRAG